MNKFSSELGKTVEMVSDSDEYKKIHYSLLLNMHLATAEVNIKSMATIPSSFLGFSKSESEHSSLLEAWVNKDNLEDNQSYENVRNHGSFEINAENPMMFSVGQLFPDGKIVENTEHTFILCKIKGKNSTR